MSTKNAPEEKKPLELLEQPRTRPPSSVLSAPTRPNRHASRHPCSALRQRDRFRFRSPVRAGRRLRCADLGRQEGVAGRIPEGVPQRRRPMGPSGGLEEFFPRFSETVASLQSPRSLALARSPGNGGEPAFLRTPAPTGRQYVAVGVSPRNAGLFATQPRRGGRARDVFRPFGACALSLAFRGLAPTAKRFRPFGTSEGWAKNAGHDAGQKLCNDATVSFSEEISGCSSLQAVREWGFGYWDLFGIWSLGFGVWLRPDAALGHRWLTSPRLLLPSPCALWPLCEIPLPIDGGASPP